MPLATLTALFPKQLGRRVLTSGGIYALARRRVLRGDPVTVLMYHTLGPDDEQFDAWTVVRRSDFIAQMQWLRLHYDIVSLDEAVAHVRGSTYSARPKVVVTFDDGHTGLYRYLLPLLDGLRLPVTIYVATGHIANGRPYWFDRVMNALQVCQAVTLELSCYGLESFVVPTGSGPVRWQLLGTLLQALKGLGPEQREVAADDVVRQLQPYRRSDFEPLAPLSIEQLRQLSRSPWVTLGAHTDCHNLLDQISIDDALASMVLSARRLREWTGRDIVHFAYPNGNHNRALMECARSVGFQTALTTRKGLWRRGDPFFAIGRIPVGRYDDLTRFKLNLLGSPWRH
ncbi:MULTISPECIES: polysaccharide deacetylase family protein [Caldimonas]|uniref:polysaccharide deacetylase family protein n=1 Tax=Caldimonas TaxID=196013 RepID=UPI000A03F635|nr:polysaccharide deacetylase family protein [Caldimonas manganoxidans]